ncbi:MAG: hypothetical protein CNLJKLNK_00005 [Holosporales bacterium]
MMIKNLLKSLGSRLDQRKMNVLSLLCGKGISKFTGYAAANKTRQDIWAPTRRMRWLVRQVGLSLILLGFLGKDGVYAFTNEQQRAAQRMVWDAYCCILRRPPDPAGITYWCKYLLDRNMSNSAIGAIYNDIVSIVGSGASMLHDNKQFVTYALNTIANYLEWLCQSSFVVTDSAINFWVNMLNTTNKTRGGVYREMITSWKGSLGPSQKALNIIDNMGSISDSDATTFITEWKLDKPEMLFKNLTGHSAANTVTSNAYSVVLTADSPIASGNLGTSGSGVDSTWMSGESITGVSGATFNLNIGGAVTVPSGITLTGVPTMNVSVSSSSTVGGTLGQSARSPFDLTSNSITGLTSFTATTQSDTLGDYLKVGSGTSVTLTKKGFGTNAVPTGEIQIQGGSTVNIDNRGTGAVTLTGAAGATSTTDTTPTYTLNNSSALYLGASTTDGKANLKGVNTAPTSATEYRYYAAPSSTASPMTIKVKKPSSDGAINTTVSNASVSFPIRDGGIMPFTIPQTGTVSITETTTTTGSTTATALTSVSASGLSSFITGGLTVAPKVPTPAPAPATPTPTLSVNYTGGTTSAVTLTPSDSATAFAIKDGAGNTLLDTVKAGTGSYVTVTAADPTTFTNLDGNASTLFWYIEPKAPATTGTLNTAYKTTSSTTVKESSVTLTNALVKSDSSRGYNISRPVITGDTNDTYISYDATKSNFAITGYESVYVPGAVAANNSYVQGHYTTQQKTSTVTPTKINDVWYVGQYGGSTYFFKSTNDPFYSIYGNINADQIQSISVNNDYLFFTPKPTTATSTYNTLTVTTTNVPRSLSTSLYDTLFSMPKKINALGAFSKTTSESSSYTDQYAGGNVTTTVTPAESSTISTITTIVSNTAASTTTTYTLNLVANTYTVAPASGTRTNVTLTSNGQYKVGNGSETSSSYTPDSSRPYNGTVYYTGLSVSPGTGTSNQQLTEAVIDKPFTSDASLLRGDVTFKGAPTAADLTAQGTYSYILTQDSPDFLGNMIVEKHARVAIGGTTLTQALGANNAVILNDQSELNLGFLGMDKTNAANAISLSNTVKVLRYETNPNVTATIVFPGRHTAAISFPISLSTGTTLLMDPGTYILDPKSDVSGILSLQSMEMQINDPVTINGLIKDVNNDSSVIINTTGAVVFNGSNTVKNLTIESGSLSLGGNFAFNTFGTIVNKGTLTNNTFTTITGDFVNQGTFSTTQTLLVSGTLTNTGTLTGVDNLKVEGTFVNNQDMIFQNGQTLYIGPKASVTTTGRIQIGSGANLELNRTDALANIADLMNKTVMQAGSSVVLSDAYDLGDRLKNVPGIKFLVKGENAAATALSDVLNTIANGGSLKYSGAVNADVTVMGTFSTTGDVNHNAKTTVQYGGTFHVNQGTTTNTKEVLVDGTSFFGNNQASTLLIDAIFENKKLLTAQNVGMIHVTKTGALKLMELSAVTVDATSTLQNEGVVTILGTATINGTFKNTGKLTNNSPNTLTFAAGSTLDNTGTLTQADNGRLVLDAAAKVVNVGGLTFESGSVLETNAASPSVWGKDVIVPTVLKSGSTLRTTTPFAGSDLSALSGVNWDMKDDSSASGLPTGTVTVAPSKTLTFSGNSIDGSVNISGSMTLTQDVQVSKSLTVSQGGQATFEKNLSNTGTIKNSGTLISEGNLTNSGTLTNEGTLNSDGVFTNNGTLDSGASGSVVNSTGTFVVYQGSTATMDTFKLAGRLNFVFDASGTTGSITAPTLTITGPTIINLIDGTSQNGLKTDAKAAVLVTFTTLSGISSTDYSKLSVQDGSPLYELVINPTGTKTIGVNNSASTFNITNATLGKDGADVGTILDSVLPSVQNASAQGVQQFTAKTMKKASERMRGGADQLEGMIKTLAEENTQMVKFKGEYKVHVTPYLTNIRSQQGVDSSMDTYYGLTAGVTQYVKDWDANITYMMGGGFNNERWGRTGSNKTVGKNVLAGLHVTKYFPDGLEWISSAHGMLSWMKRDRINNNQWFNRAYRALSLSARNELGWTFKLDNGFSVRPDVGVQLGYDRQGSYTEYNTATKASAFSQRANISRSAEVYAGFGLRQKYVNDGFESKLTLTYEVGQRSGGTDASSTYYVTGESSPTVMTGQKTGRLAHYISLYGSVLDLKNNWKIIPGFTMTLRRGSQAYAGTCKFEYRF